MFNKMFDFNHDGKLDATERALEYMNFRAVTDVDDDFDDDDRSYEDSNSEEDW